MNNEVVIVEFQAILTSISADIYVWTDLEGPPAQRHGTYFKFLGNHQLCILLGIPTISPRLKGQPSEHSLGTAVSQCLDKANTPKKDWASPGNLNKISLQVQQSQRTSLIWLCNQNDQERLKNSNFLDPDHFRV